MEPIRSRPSATEPESPSGEWASKYFQSVRTYRRQQAIEQYRDGSHLFWMLDPTPDDIRDVLRMNAPARTSSLIRVRGWTSWHNLARHAKRGRAELLVPPTLWALVNFLKVPDVSLDKLALANPRDSLLLGSVVALLTAQAVFRAYCPRVVRWASDPEGKPGSPDPTRDVASECSDVLLSEVAVLEITAHDLRWLEGRERELARVLVDRGHCSRAGFTQGGRYLVERLVLATSKASKASAYVAQDGRDGWDPLTHPGFVFPARRTTLWLGILERHSKYDDTPEIAAGDFKLRWYETDVSRVPGTAVSSYLDGVEQLVTQDTQAEILNELARWVSYKRPGPRLLTACCFFLAYVLLVLWLAILVLRWVTHQPLHPS